ncbi:MAG: DUF4388 domain-containing protein [Candidatus Brocadiae bacterium]|nr:DUF4388 domain-containing protein [Candidatus Brocadiia bacterium]
MDNNKTSESSLEKKKQLQIPTDGLQQLRAKYFQLLKENKSDFSQKKSSSTIDYEAEQTKAPWNEPAEETPNKIVQQSLIPPVQEIKRPNLPPPLKNPTPHNIPALKDACDCKQPLIVVLSLIQNTLEKILLELHEISPNLDLSHAFNKALQILRKESMENHIQGEESYLTFLELLQDRIYVAVLFNSTPVSWSDIAINLQEKKECVTPPCKLFYFLFRLLSIFLRCIKDKVNKEQKSQMAISILQILESTTMFLKPAQNVCSLKEIFQYCRKNSIPNRVECVVQKWQSPQDQSISVEQEVAQQEEQEEYTQEIEQEEIPSENEKSDSIFSGNLSYISIWQILQMLSMEKKEGCLNIILPDDVIKIYLKDGTVLHCESSEYQGEDLFYHALYQEKGRFTFDNQASTDVASINQPIEYLLMEGARLLDEYQREQG